MRILVVHNRYLYGGGEDVVYEQERRLLSDRGNSISFLEMDNRNIEGINKIRLALNTVWSGSNYNKLIRTIKDFQPEIMHCHNTFPLFSPSIYHAAKDAGVPVVQTLHNYRLVCPAATLYRSGSVCELCVGNFIPWQGILYRCYKESRLQSTVVASMLSIHKFLRTWTDKIDAYVALTEHAKRIFTVGGLPENKLFVKPNFLYPEPEPPKRVGPGQYFVFVGRLSPVKGIRFLVNAWLSMPDIPLKILGQGPFSDDIHQTIMDNGAHHIELLGQVNRNEVFSLLSGAIALVLPSEWYEGFPMTILESIASEVPVIASNLGSMSEIIHDHETGLLFSPKDEMDLRAKVQWAWENPKPMLVMGRKARKSYEESYSANSNYAQLMDIYQRAMEVAA